MSNTQVTRREENLPKNLKGRPVVSPLVDVFESKDEYLVVADMPGVDKENLGIRLDQGELTVEGCWTCEEKGAPIAREYRPLDFRRVFIVPDGVKEEAISAALANGVLTLRLPKAEAVKPRRITVQVS